jgi:hypothetical protein
LESVLGQKYQVLGDASGITWGFPHRASASFRIFDKKAGQKEVTLFFEFFKKNENSKKK